MQRFRQVALPQCPGGCALLVDDIPPSEGYSFKTAPPKPPPRNPFLLNLPHQIPPPEGPQHLQLRPQHLPRRAAPRFLFPTGRAGGESRIALPRHRISSRPRQGEQRTLPPLQPQRLHPTGHRLPKPRMPPLLHCQSLQHTAMLPIQKHTTRLRKVRRKFLRQLSLLRPPRRRLPSSPLLLQPIPTSPAQFPKLLPKRLDHLPDHPHLLLPQDHPVMTTRRPTLRQVTHSHPPRKRPMIHRRLPHLPTQ